MPACVCAHANTSVGLHTGIDAFVRIYVLCIRQAIARAVVVEWHAVVFVMGVRLVPLASPQGLAYSHRKICPVATPVKTSDGSQAHADSSS